MSAKTPNRVRHERDRTVLLEILTGHGVNCEMEFRELLDHADLRDRPMSLEGLDFHIRYMAGKDWVGFREETPPDSKVKKIATVWITAHGVDIVDDAA
jgi:hypothetical protein